MTDAGSGKTPGRDVTGILLLDKPLGLSSNAALQVARRLYGARKAGHTGSLDPLASGMLPICFGEATKVSGLMLDAAKTYDVTARLGARTDTGDAEGRVIGEAEWRHLTRAGLEAVLDRFRGPIEQVPPMYSALKHRGERLYRIARRGETVERPPRPVTIHELELRDMAEGSFSLGIRCSKGTYVRVLIEDVAAAAGSLAHVTALRRLQTDPFRASGMVSMETLQGLAEQGTEALDNLLLPPDAALPDLPAVSVDSGDALRLVQGQKLATGAGMAPGPVRLYGPDHRFLGLGEVETGGWIAPRRLMRPPGQD